MRPAETEPPRAWRRTIILCSIFAAAIAVIGLLNLLIPRNFLLFAFDHHSYLSVGSQIGWLILTLGVIAVIIIRREIAAVRAWTGVLVAIVLMGSFFAFHTVLPVVHGDGEVGGSPLAENPAFRAYPGVDGRLQSFLSFALSRSVPDVLSFRYYFSSLYQNAERNECWILLTVLCGVAIVVLISVVVWRLPISSWQKLALQIFVLCSEPMLNAYGHFDSYVVPVLCLACWYASFLFLRVRRGVWKGLSILLLTALLATWAHPILAILAVYSVILAVLLLLADRRVCLPVNTVLLIGLVIGISPYLIHKGNADWFDPQNAHVLGWLAHEKIMSCLQVCFPALLLAALLPAQYRSRRARLDPFCGLALVIIVSNLCFFVSLWTGYGVRDEFVYSIFGAMILGAVVILVLRTWPSPRLVGCAAVLSVYLFVPRVYVYSCDLLYQRFANDMLHDRCAANRLFSPYYLIASLNPVDAAHYRQERLRVLESGVKTPISPWDQDLHRSTCLAHYTAWCFEFGETNQGLKGLSWFVENQPDVVFALWKGNGRPFLTDHYLNQSPRISRDLSKELIAAQIQRHPDSKYYKKLSERLEQVEMVDPVVQYSPRFSRTPVR